MSATTAGAVKAFIETLGLGVPVFRDRVPMHKVDVVEVPLDPPFILVQDGIATTAERTGDNASKRATEIVQVDLYEKIRADATGVRLESYTLADDLLRALNGARLRTSPTTVYRVTASKTRVKDHDLNELRNSYTLTVRRRL